MKSKTEEGEGLRGGLEHGHPLALLRARLGRPRRRHHRRSSRRPSDRAIPGPRLHRREGWLVFRCWKQSSFFQVRGRGLALGEHPFHRPTRAICIWPGAMAHAIKSKQRTITQMFLPKKVVEPEAEPRMLLM